MADTKSDFTVSIVTPDGQVYSSDEASLVIVETMLGELGILANHVPLIVSLKIGETRVKLADGKTEIIATNGGFAEFSDNTLTVVADSAELKGNIDVSRADSARKRAEQEIKEAQAKKDTDSAKRAEVALQRAVNRINVSKK